MSWFDTTGFATLAKSALKEAQKTIDKALDIQDEDRGPNESSSVKGKISSAETPSSSSDASFFSTWGLEGSSSQSPPSTVPPKNLPQSSKMTNSASLWGSFTGSFFDAQQHSQMAGNNPNCTETVSEVPEQLVSDQPKKSAPSRSLSLNLVPNAEPPTSEDIPDGEQIKEEIRSYPHVDVIMRKKEPKNIANRLSVISSESDRRSSDSCEVLGSTPDSDPNTFSTSSSVAKLRQSGSFESVEVLTSQSSVDVLPNSNVTSPSDHKHSSDSISPIAESDGVEVIREDEDEVSVEDSYTSASETTLTVTVLDHSKANLMLKSTSSLETSFSEAMSPRENRQQLGMILTHSPSPSMDSSTEAVMQPLRKDKISGSTPASTPSFPGAAQPQQPCDLVVTEAPKLSIPSPRVSESLSSYHDSSQAETSSCDEGTIMGSSDGAMDISRVSRSEMTTMIADAMTEPDPPVSLLREQSPISSERSDLVKIGSSEHTSGDELETATSSDIEIISSPTPNGSSTASRQSPTKSNLGRSVNLGKILTSKVKCHHREPSEASSGGSDECTEVDKMLKRISEMTEVLEARESKLIDLSRINAELNETIAGLKHQLERQNEAQALKQMNEDFTQRLAALERTATKEKEQLKKQLEQAKATAAVKDQDSDKDQVILELREEGEKLSKQQLALNNIIKKLRAAEKENIKLISSLKDQLSNTSQELERSKKAMSAKEKMERSQIEAVHNLTKQVTNLEKELAISKNNVSSLTSTLISTQREMEGKEQTFKESETKLKLDRAELEQKAREEVTDEIEALQLQVVRLQCSLDDIGQQMAMTQQQHSKQEGSFRREISDILARAESAERKLETALEAARLASQPLASQLQAQAVAYDQAQAQWERQESALNTIIRELESKVTALTASERNVRKQYESSSTQLHALEGKLSALLQQNESLIAELTSNKESMEKMKVLKNSEIKKYQTDKDRLAAELDEKKREVTSLKEVLNIERSGLEAEKRKSAALTEQLRVANKAGQVLSSSPQPLATQPSSPPPSPTLSVGRTSMTDSLSSNIWPNFGEDVHEPTSSRFVEVLRPGNNSSFIETLQSQLKLREGEVQQLQWEVARLDSERSSLRDEVAELSAKLAVQTEDVESLALIKTQYDALLQMYGEKVEECQELKMDLDDMKDMYKAQIEELLKGKSPVPSSHGSSS